MGGSGRTGRAVPGCTMRSGLVAGRVVRELTKAVATSRPLSPEVRPSVAGTSTLVSTRGPESPAARRNPGTSGASQPRCRPRRGRRDAIKEGGKGDLLADFAFVRVTRAPRGGRPATTPAPPLRSPPNTRRRLLTHRGVNAPADCPRDKIARLSRARWPVEVAFEEAKGEIAMDHHEVRTWRGWHHHMTQTILTHHVLRRMRLPGEKPGPDARPSAAASHRRPRGARPCDAHPGARHRALPRGAELRRVLFPRETDHRAARTPTGA